jgi:S1-C subfamily serine protease
LWKDCDVSAVPAGCQASPTMMSTTVESSMNYRFVSWTPFGVLGLVPGIFFAAGASAQSVVYRCPGPPVRYATNFDITPAEATELKCRVIEGAPTIEPPPKPPARLVRPAPPRSPPVPAEQMPRRWSGSALLVAKEGILLTNSHVVAGCKSLTSSQPNGPAAHGKVLHQDLQSDLAIVKIPPVGSLPAMFRSTPSRAGEQVIALGFPYKGLLSSEVIVSTGTVSALAGLRGDQTRLQIQAPIQPGNSGGPLIDASGAVVGVVVAKLDEVSMAKATGGLPQNVNFAVKGSVAMRFLDQHGVQYLTTSPVHPKRDLPDVVAEAKSWVYQLECQR